MAATFRLLTLLECLCCLSDLLVCFITFQRMMPLVENAFIFIQQTDSWHHFSNLLYVRNMAAKSSRGIMKLSSLSEINKICVQRWTGWINRWAAWLVCTVGWQWSRIVAWNMPIWGKRVVWEFIYSLKWHKDHLKNPLFRWLFGGGALKIILKSKDCGQYSCK